MRYFIDMDGTLAVYPNTKEWWMEPGIFERLDPQEKVIKAVKQLIKNGEDVFVLSAYNKDTPEVKAQKSAWLDKYIPELKEENRVFMCCGESKAAAVPGGIHNDDVLLDDYNPNLEDWSENGGVGIKILNGINSPKSWDGISVKAKGTIKEIVNVMQNVSLTFDALERSLGEETLNKEFYTVDAVINQKANNKKDIKQIKNNRRDNLER